MRTLEKLKISNFKSIREQTLALGPLNVFIGGNGSGKSNLIEIFKFLREILSQHLGQYTAIKGGADALLYFGRKASPQMALSLEFAEGQTSNKYEVSLLGTNDDTLIIQWETGYYHDREKHPEKPFDRPISANSKESKLRNDRHLCTS